MASSRTPVADIPVPVGFEMVEPISRNYLTSGSRIVDHTYRGKGDKLVVKNFYLKHMPIKGWTIRRLQMVRGIYRLNCEKGQETCDVTIDSLERTFGGYLTTVTAHVQPMAQGQIK
ncbi:MAG: hypothetical protein OER86_08405 [Phycisphaerae bacterium]|nr:hypothetical protein [Phycisphaerae bacterium]